MSRHCAACWPTDHTLSLRHFDFAFLLLSFDEGRECYINLSASLRCTINCGIPSIQNKQIDRAQVAGCTLLVSCSTDLDDCVVFVDRLVDVFLEHVHRTLKASERFTAALPVVSLYFTRLLAPGASPASTAIVIENLNRSQASFGISRHDNA